MFLYQKKGYDYKHLDITSLSKMHCELQYFIELAKKEKPDYICYDTEDDGLNIITSKPFLVSVGFNKHIITFDYDKDVVDYLWKLIIDSGIQDNENYIGLFAHNAKFDYHMMINGGSKVPEELRIYDSITIARLTEYCDERESMSLEHLGMKYVDDTAKFAGGIIKKILQTINKERRDVLREKIIENFPNDGFTSIRNGKVKSNGKLTNLINDYDKGRVKFVNDDNVYYKFIDENYTPANYKDVYEREHDLMLSYAADDVVIMLEYMSKAFPTLHKVDKDLTVLRREGELIRAVANMERNGIKVDIDYMLECRKQLMAYKELLYLELFILTGEEFTVGQHEYIKKMLKNKYGVTTSKADVKALKYIRDNCATADDDMTELQTVCNNIIELRTVDKWLSTYIDGKLNSIIDGRIHTDINNSGAVSGRVSCDMQQQPKEPLYDSRKLDIINKELEDGLYEKDKQEHKDRLRWAELFHPRRMFVCDEGSIFAFCDESQMELRVLAFFTILYSSSPDIGLCRAYMPYLCHDSNGVEFDYNNREHITGYAKHSWYNNEDDKPWTPTDLHSETTHHAFPEVPMDSPKFKKLRKLGKRANFLKVYEGGVKALQESLDIDEDTAKALDSAFYKAFPRIRDYQEYTNKHITQYGYAENLYGRRYYMDNSMFFYKVSNYLIQGTCADMVKVFEINVDKYLRENNLKSKLLLPIHDELMLSIDKDEMFVIDKVKEIMEDVGDVIKCIPMISEPEISTTNWAEKKEYKKEG